MKERDPDCWGLRSPRPQQPTLKIAFDETIISIHCSNHGFGLFVYFYPFQSAPRSELKLLLRKCWTPSATKPQNWTVQIALENQHQVKANISNFKMFHRTRRLYAMNVFCLESNYKFINSNRYASVIKCLKCIYYKFTNWQSFWHLTDSGAVSRLPAYCLHFLSQKPGSVISWAMQIVKATSTRTKAAISGRTLYFCMCQPEK